MAIPEFVDEIYFEEGISAVAASRDGAMIAVGTKGLLGLYRMEQRRGKGRLVHVASYVVPDDADVNSIFFSGNGSRLSVTTEDGFRRELALGVRVEGLLQEVQDNVPIAA